MKRKYKRKLKKVCNISETYVFTEKNVKKDVLFLTYLGIAVNSKVTLKTIKIQIKP